MLHTAVDLPKTIKPQEQQVWTSLKNAMTQSNDPLLRLFSGSGGASPVARGGPQDLRSNRRRRQGPAVIVKEEPVVPKFEEVLQTVEEREQTFRALYDSSMQKLYRLSKDGWLDPTDTRAVVADSLTAADLRLQTMAEYGQNLSLIMKGHENDMANVIKESRVFQYQHLAAEYQIIERLMMIQEEMRTRFFVANTSHRRTTAEACERHLMGGEDALISHVVHTVAISDAASEEQERIKMAVEEHLMHDLIASERSLEQGQEHAERNLMQLEDLLRLTVNEADKLRDKCRAHEERHLMAAEDHSMRHVVQIEAETERHHEEVERYRMTFEDTLSKHAAQAEILIERTAEDRERHLMSVEDALALHTSQIFVVRELATEKTERYTMTLEDSLQSHVLQVRGVREAASEHAERHLMACEDFTHRTLGHFHAERERSSIELQLAIEATERALMEKQDIHVRFATRYEAWDKSHRHVAERERLTQDRLHQLNSEAEEKLQMAHEDAAVDRFEQVKELTDKQAAILSGQRESAGRVREHYDMAVEDALSRAASHIPELVALHHEMMEVPLMVAEDQLAHGIRAIAKAEGKVQGASEKCESLEVRLKAMVADMEEAEAGVEVAIEAERAIHQSQVEVLEQRIEDDPLKPVIVEIEEDIMVAHEKNGELEGEAESITEKAELFESRRLEAIAEHEVSLTALRTAAFDKSEVAQRAFVKEQEERQAVHLAEAREVEVLLAEEEETTRALADEYAALKKEKRKALNALRPAHERHDTAIRVVQALVRLSSARWKSKRETAIRQVQRMARLSSARWKSKRETAIQQVQRIVRGSSTRQSIRREAAAQLLQIRRETAVHLLQSITRGKSIRDRIGREQAERNAAALTIQCCWHSSVARHTAAALVPIPALSFYMIAKLKAWLARARISLAPKVTRLFFTGLQGSVFPEEHVIISALVKSLACDANAIALGEIRHGPPVPWGTSVVVDMSIDAKVAPVVWRSACEGTLTSRLREAVEDQSPGALTRHEMISCEVARKGLVDATGVAASWKDVSSRAVRKARKRKARWNKMRDQLSSLAVVERLQLEIEEKRRKEAVIAAAKEETVRNAAMALLRGDVQIAPVTSVRAEELKHQHHRALSRVAEKARRRASSNRASAQEKRVAMSAGIYGSVGGAVKKRGRAKGSSSKKAASVKSGNESDDVWEDEVVEKNLRSERIVKENRAEAKNAHGKLEEEREDKRRNKEKAEEVAAEAAAAAAAAAAEAAEAAEAQQKEQEEQETEREAMISVLAAQKAKRKLMKKLAKQRAAEEDQRLAKEMEEENRRRALAERKEAEAQEERARVAALQASEAEAKAAEEAAEKAAAEEARKAREVKEAEALSSVPAILRKDKFAVKKKVTLKGAAKMVGRMAVKKAAGKSSKGKAAKGARTEAKADDGEWEDFDDSATATMMQEKGKSGTNELLDEDGSTVLEDGSTVVNTVWNKASEVQAAEEVSTKWREQAEQDIASSKGGRSVALATAANAISRSKQLKSKSKGASDHAARTAKSAGIFMRQVKKAPKGRVK
jgi:hypothetical protein